MTDQNQIPIDFSELQHIENNAENQQHFENNKKRFSKQCQIVYDAFKRGERLTTAVALLKYSIGDLRRRVKDLKDIWQIPVKSETVDGKYKEYFLENECDKLNVIS